MAKQVGDCVHDVCGKMCVSISKAERVCVQNTQSVCVYVRAECFSSAVFFV